MTSWNRLQKLTAIAVGATGGLAIYFYTGRKSLNTVSNSWTTNTIVSPEIKWDSNWDHREPSSLVKPIKKRSIITETEENEHNDKLEKSKPKAVRNIILIRHGQYNLDGKTDLERTLTKLGRSQAERTGTRLKELNFPWTNMVKSTMTRAQETGSIISEKLPDVPVEHCSLIEEGAPIEPEPPVGHWRPEPSFFIDGARIEAGFRKHFHRADPKQEKDSYTLIVCHANVIRYYVCRALQFPPQAWLRMSLNHASLTWLSILPSGRVIVRCLGDSGHMPLDYLTTS